MEGDSTGHHSRLEAQWRCLGAAVPKCPVPATVRTVASSHPGSTGNSHPRPMEGGPQATRPMPFKRVKVTKDRMPGEPAWRKEAPQSPGRLLVSVAGFLFKRSFPFFFHQGQLVTLNKDLWVGYQYYINVKSDLDTCFGRKCPFFKEKKKTKHILG